MQKSIVIPIILMIIMIIPAFGMSVNTDYNQTPVEPHPTVITNSKSTQEPMQELASTGNVTVCECITNSE
jgi:hypothetical protein